MINSRKLASWVDSLSRLDGSETGYWDKESSQWKQLDSRYNSVILEGLRIARKEVAPNLLTLPIPAAEAGQ